MDITFDMDVNLSAWARAIGYQIVGDYVVPEKMFSLNDFTRCVSDYISESITAGTNSGVVEEKFMVNDDEQDILKDMLNECDTIMPEFVAANGQERYIVIELVERDITGMYLADTWEEAFDAMCERFKEKASDEIDDEFPENVREYVSTSDYDTDSIGISANSAWYNGSDNHDWKIIKVTFAKQEVKLEL